MSFPQDLISIRRHIAEAQELAARLAYDPEGKADEKFTANTINDMLSITWNVTQRHIDAKKREKRDG